ncbi:hypothetical protein D9M68_698140 [compost metagenome]
MHECHAGNVRRQPAQCLSGLGPLQGDQSTRLEQRLDHTTITNVTLQVGEVLILAGSIDHHEEFVLGQARDHQVIEDSAFDIGEQRIALHADRQIDDIDRHQAFQSNSCLSAAQDDLPHVGDIEQAGLLAGVQVLLEHTQRVLHWHVVASERHHARAEFEVQRVQWSLGKIFSGHVALSRGCATRTRVDSLVRTAPYDGLSIR